MSLGFHSIHGRAAQGGRILSRSRSFEMRADRTPSSAAPSPPPADVVVRFARPWRAAVSTRSLREPMSLLGLLYLLLFAGYISMAVVALTAPAAFEFQLSTRELRNASALTCAFDADCPVGVARITSSDACDGDVGDWLGAGRNEEAFRSALVETADGAAAQYTLLAAFAAAAAFQLLHLATVLRILYETRCDERLSLDRACAAGGFEARGFEAAVVTPLLLVLVANDVGVDDLVALTGVALAAFSLAQLGAAIERLAQSGAVSAALAAFYVPFMALLVAALAPLGQAVWATQGIACADEPSFAAFLRCTAPTCFGARVGAGMYPALLSLALLPSLGLAAKLYALSAYSDWCSPCLVATRRACGQSLLTAPLYWAAFALAHGVGVAVFATLVGPLLAVSHVTRACLRPVLPRRYACDVRHAAPRRVVVTVMLRSETFFAAADAALRFTVAAYLYRI
jgi:hypothetical protein